MKSFGNITTLLLGIILLASGSASEAAASDWTYWRPVGHGISVSFTKVKENWEGGNAFWTWKFRNDNYATVKSINFEYREYPLGKFSETRRDICPVRLSSGEVWGGWATFSATSWLEPSITILSVDRD